MDVPFKAFRHNFMTLKTNFAAKKDNEEKRDLAISASNEVTVGLSRWYR